MRRTQLVVGSIVVMVGVAIACGGDAPIAPGTDLPRPVDDAAADGLRTVASDEPTAFLSVGGTASDDVWVVGADKGAGPAVVHFDGTRWERLQTGQRGDLWWVHATGHRQAYFGGSEGTILRFENGRFERLRTRGLGKQTVFGVWASPAGELWAVGGAAGRDGFVWRMRDGELETVPLPRDLPRRPDGEVPSLLKVWGDDDGNVWIVGDRGTILRSRDGGPLEVVPSGTTERLFAVFGAVGGVTIAGGTGRGILLDGADSFVERQPEGAALLQGVCVSADGAGWAVGQKGLVLRRADGRWSDFAHRPPSAVESLHSVWCDPTGAAWIVGGNVMSPRLDGGVILHHGPGVPTLPREADVVPPTAPVCPEEAVDPAPTRSIARRWNEQILGAIRRDLPRPGVHARNLFHLSAAMWDAWSAYSPVSDGWLSHEKVVADDVENARRDAISFAAYRILTHRYGKAVGGSTSGACFDAFLGRLGLDPTNDDESGTSGRALGNRIARQYIEAYAADGANEAADYADTTSWQPKNPPLVVDEPGTSVVDLGEWQPLNLSIAATQNGLVLPAGIQSYIGAQWGDVRPFALTRSTPAGAYVDPGPPPGSDVARLRPWALEVLRRTSELDVASSETFDASPAAIGNNPLGTNDGRGHPINPATSAPYAANVVKVGDFGRVLAEFWADGPKSETPPGHWNVIANTVADQPTFGRRLWGDGEPLDVLAWDVAIYFVLNGALHDAAIAAWDVKRSLLGPRPITLIRFMGGKGQSSAPSLTAYSAEGLPLVPGLVELVSEESVRSGRHAALAPFVGEVAVRSWRGEPGDRVADVGGVEWIRAVDWLPYQRRTFVTPAFPGFVSGHSTFSRAAAEVLTAVTGSAFFPGGFAEVEVKKDVYLTFERGPSETVRLQWATYFDAADQAGQSRIWGGIHIAPDDFVGRRIGRTAGLAAVDKARAHFAGTAVP